MKAGGIDKFGSSWVLSPNCLNLLGFQDV